MSKKIDKPQGYEQRVATVGLEKRGDGGSEPVIRGHAAVFDQLSEDLGGFREKIAPGAFSRALKEKHDVRALFNHDPNHVIGRSPKTLRMKEDDVGLAVEIDPPASAANLLELMERGDVTQMSFGFVVQDDEWEERADGDIRTVKDVDLFDVSVVTYPAYPQTDAAVRSHDQWKAEREIAEESEHNGAPVEDEKAIADALEALRLARLELEAQARWLHD